MLELILGGARSGKSAYAERRAREAAAPVVYIATGAARDEEMRARIERHRAARPAEWYTIEAPHRLAAALREHAAPDRCVIVDCLTLWLSNLLDQVPESDLPGPLFASERAALIDALPQLPGRVLLVSNEVGSGVVPLGKLSRVFVDEAGRLHQSIALHCDRVVLMAAGYPIVAKGA